MPKPSNAGSPAPSRAPIAPVSAMALPPVADATLLADAPLPIPPVVIGDLAIGETGNQPAAGVGNGGEGVAPGSGIGDGDGARLAPMQGAAWITYPSEFELLRSWPMEARRRGISGLVKLSCIVPRPGRPKRCTLLSETPARRGFGRSALYLWPDFRIRPVMRDKATIDLPIIVTLAFDFKKTSPGKDAKGKR